MINLWGSIQLLFSFPLFNPTLCNHIASIVATKLTYTASSDRYRNEIEEETWNNNSVYLCPVFALGQNKLWIRAGEMSQIALMMTSAPKFPEALSTPVTDRRWELNPEFVCHSARIRKSCCGSPGFRPEAFFVIIFVPFKLLLFNLPDEAFASGSVLPKTLAVAKKSIIISMEFLSLMKPLLGLQF